MEKTERKQKLKIREILDDINTIDIKAFILQYSKRNKDFEIAFKSHFLSRINIGDKGLKYKKILEEIIKPKTIRNNKIGATTKRTITIILEDLSIQMNDCLSTDSFTEAYYLIKECLEKIAYLQNRYEIKDLAIEKCRQRFLSGLGVVLKKDLAPVFRKDLEKNLNELINKSYYIPNSNNLISLLNEHNVFIESDKDLIIQDLEKKINHDNYNNIVKTIIELSCPFVELVKKTLLKFDHKKIFEALIQLIQEGKFKSVEFLLSNEDLAFKHNKSILLATLSNAKEDYPNLTKHLKEINIAETDIFLLSTVLDDLDPIYLKKELPKLKKWVAQLPFHKKSALYAKGKRYKELVKLLREKKDLEWIKHYDTELLEQEMEKDVEELYLELTGDYVENHIGIKAQDFLNKLKFHLRSTSQLDLLYKLQKHLSKNYQHRDSVKYF